MARTRCLLRRRAPRLGDGVLPSPAPRQGPLGRPASVLAADCAGLPWTLLHGDAKVANFALLPGRRVAAFDWQLLGIGPATLDLGWYLAVNAGRLARPKEHVIARYRDLLDPT